MAKIEILAQYSYRTEDERTLTVDADEFADDEERAVLNALERKHIVFSSTEDFMLDYVELKS
jgi:hypothetical protein